MLFEHFKFLKRDRQLGETVDEFGTSLSTRIQEKLLQTPSLGLNKAIHICHSLESSVATQKEINKDFASVEAISARFNN